MQFSTDLALMSTQQTYKGKQRETFNHFDNIVKLFDVLPNFPKRSAIISNKHSIYELPNELPNDLRLRILEN